jgi:SAM-dependent methyltransferase
MAKGGGFMSGWRGIMEIPLALLFIVISPIILLVNLLMPRAKYLALQKSGEAREIDYRINQMKGAIKKGDFVLDIGCGSGRFCLAIQTKIGARVMGVDVIDYASAPVPIEIYDGAKLPFPDNHFDVVIMAFMLHHVENQDILFSEAVRCSKSRLIVFEDAYQTYWQRLFVIWNDYYSNIFVGAVKVFRGAEDRSLLDIPMPLTFRSVDGWQEFFKGFGLKMLSLSLRQASHKPHSKVTFVLEKPQDQFDKAITAF